MSGSPPVPAMVPSSAPSQMDGDKLMARLRVEELVPAAWERMLTSIVCLPCMGPFGPRVVALLSKSHSVTDILIPYITRLGTAFLSCLTDDPTQLDEATLLFTQRRYELEDEFTDDERVSGIFDREDVQDIFQGEEWEFDNAESCYPGFIFAAFFKEFMFRAYNLDPPDVLCDLRSRVEGL